MVVLAVATAIAGFGVLLVTAQSGTSAVPRISPETTIAAFYGDSYTQGIGATDDSKRWSSIVSTDRGWTEFNPSVDGLGFVRNRDLFGDGDLPDLIIAKAPPLVIVTLGLNDNFAFEGSAPQIAEQIPLDLNRLQLALPLSRMVVVEPFWYTDVRPKSVEVISGWVKQAAVDVGAQHIGGASRWIEGHPEWMAADGLHPNDIGYSVIASRMSASLAKLGL